MLNPSDIEAPLVLSNKEYEILEYVAIGDSAKEAAMKMSIAPRTVERHIENIRLKLHAKNRAHMVMCAIISGTLKVTI